MYLQLAQRSQAEQQFNNGIAGMVASLYPGRTSSALVSALRGNVQDPSEVFGSLMKLQMFNQQEQLFGQQMARYNDLVGNSDQYAKSFGVDPTMFKATITAAGPQGVGDVLGKIAEAQMGITGTQTDKEYRQAVRNFQAANQGQPLPPELQSEAAFVAQQGANVTEANARAKDLQADQHDFAAGNADYNETESLLTWLKAHPDATAAAVHEGSWATGRAGQFQQWLGTVDQDTATAASNLQKLQGKLYGSSWKGRGGRLSQLEAGKISEGFSTLSNPSTPTDAITDQVGDLLNKTVTAHGNLYGAAGMPAPSNYYDAMDSQYKDKGKLFAGSTRLDGGGSSGPSAPPGPGGPQPVTVQTPDDVAKLKSGTPFIIPAGPNKGKIGYAP